MFQTGKTRDIEPRESNDRLEMCKENFSIIRQECSIVFHPRFLKYTSYEGFARTSNRSRLIVRGALPLIRWFPLLSDKIGSVRSPGSLQVKKSRILTSYPFMGSRSISRGPWNAAREKISCVDSLLKIILSRFLCVVSVKKLSFMYRTSELKILTFSRH